MKDIPKESCDFELFRINESIIDCSKNLNYFLSGDDRLFFIDNFFRCCSGTAKPEFISKMNRIEELNIRFTNILNLKTQIRHLLEQARYRGYIKYLHMREIELRENWGFYNKISIRVIDGGRANRIKRVDFSKTGRQKRLKAFRVTTKG